MPKLTITASNLNRLNVSNCKRSEYFIKSIQWQDFKDFELLIADGGSDNYEEIKQYFENYGGKIPMRIIQYKIDLFSRSFLNNLGIRNANSKYIATTDVDMLFAKNFVSEVIENVGKNILVESRTMYLKKLLMEKIYNDELNPYNNIHNCKRGRIKKRTSAGGFQCMHINSWTKLRGFDERYKVWGSEDYDLLTRSKMAGIKTKWIGESRESIKLFHQQHSKKNIKNDLKWQEKNKKILNNITNYIANLDTTWGAKK